MGGFVGLLMGWAAGSGVIGGMRLLCLGWGCCVWGFWMGRGWWMSFGEMVGGERTEPNG